VDEFARRSDMTPDYTVPAGEVNNIVSIFRGIAAD